MTPRLGSALGTRFNSLLGPLIEHGDLTREQTGVPPPESSARAAIGGVPCWL